MEKYLEATNGSIDQMEAIERESIINALKRNEGSMRRTANDLGISLLTLGRKMRKYDIERP